MAILYEVATLTDAVIGPPFALIRVDTEKYRGAGLEGVVVSLHHSSEEASARANELISRPLCDCERSHNGIGLMSRECDCLAPTPPKQKDG